MANLYVDTARLRENGERIISISNELSENFNQLFDRITNIPSKSFEWVGEGANVFSNSVSKEKNNYISLKNNVYSYGKYLVDMAEELERTINNNRIGG